jgi:glycine cleavage system H protein
MNMLFTKDHLWIEVEGDIATVGLTEHASNWMENVLYVELPKSAQFVNKSDVVATIETEDTEQEISSPLTGDVIESNELLTDSPDAVNHSTHEDAWLFKMYVSDETELEDLMSEEEYQDYLYEQV